MTMPRPTDSREMGLVDFLDAPSDDLFEKARRFAGFISDARSRGHSETYLRPVRRYEGGSAVVDGGDNLEEHRVVVMCSADYLGLAHDPSVVRAAKDALDAFGTSVSSVPLIAGSTCLHSDLQGVLADSLGVEAVVLFPTGHAANLGVLQALCGPNDLAVLDELVHCSLWDGVRLSGAKKITFRHSDVEDLVRVLSAARENKAVKGILVVIEGVYGIDGDLAPLRQIKEVAESFGARILLDDAHATGVLGERGRGSAEHYAVPIGDMVVMGSLSKSLGSMGGWIAAPSDVADYLRYYARTIMFSVGLQTSSVAAGLAAMKILKGDLKLLDRLRSNATYFRDGLGQLGFTNPSRSGSAIVSVEVGGESRLRELLRNMFRAGLWAEGLPYPAVARGTERVRFRVSALHSKEELNSALEVVAQAFRGVE